MTGAAAARLTAIGGAVRRRWPTVLAIAFATLATTSLAQLAALAVRFGNLPNYITIYDWPGNVLRIVRSTPAWSDMPPIIAEEWLVEIGYMNDDYGLGISEWALTLIPATMLLVFATGTLVGLLFVLLSQRRSCSRGDRLASTAAGGLGAALVALTSITMSWVVCCATPSWVVGLAMLGLGTATSLWLEPVGGWLALAGFMLLASAVAWAAGSVHHPPFAAAGGAVARAHP